MRDKIFRFFNKGKTIIQEQSYENKLDIALLKFYLIYIKAERGKDFYLQEFRPWAEDFIGKNEADHFISTLYSDGYITDDEFPQITKEGLRFFIGGGYTERNEQTRIQKAKLKYETTLIRWQLKTFWWLFSVSILGFVISICAIVISTRKDNQIQMSTPQLQLKIDASKVTHP